MQRMVHGPASDDPGGDPHEHVDYPGGIGAVLDL